MCEAFEQPPCISFKVLSSNTFRILEISSYFNVSCSRLLLFCPWVQSNRHERAPARACRRPWPFEWKSVNHLGPSSKSYLNSYYPASDGYRLKCLPVLHLRLGCSFMHDTCALSFKRFSSRNCSRQTGAFSCHVAFIQSRFPLKKQDHQGIPAILVRTRTFSSIKWQNRFNTPLPQLHDICLSCHQSAGNFQVTLLTMIITWIRMWSSMNDY